MRALKLTLSVCLATCFLTCLDSGDLQEMEVKPGADVLLQCQGPRDADIRLLKWSRPDLESEGYVYFFRDNHLYEDIQHPSFHGRVKLRDPHMKDGDFSVTLKNVIVNDTGRYECEIINSKTGGKPELISTINLKVEPGHTLGDGEDRENRNGGNDNEGNDGGGKDGGNVGLDVILSVAVLCVCIVVSVVIFRIYRGRTEQNRGQNQPQVFTVSNATPAVTPLSTPPSSTMSTPPQTPLSPPTPPPSTS